MIEIALLSLLGIGATVALLVELFGSDNDTDQPEVPGSGDDDTLTGTDGSDFLDGMDGNDVINAGLGDDTALGGIGNDLLQGGGGMDTLDGGDGSDSLFGGAGDDVTFGRMGNDLQSGGNGDDELWGAQGDDFLTGDLGADTMIGGNGDDVLIGVDLGLGNAATAAEIATALGTPSDGNDEDAGDVMIGGYGDDLFLIGSGDTATGDEGDDVFALGDWIETGRAATITDFTAGEDVITLAYDASMAAPEVTVTEDDAGNALISFNGELVATVIGAGETLTVDDVSLIAEDRSGDGGVTTPGQSSNIQGTTGNDTLSGTNADEFMNGLEGDDVLWGGGGDDDVFGRAGDDVLVGGAGADRAFGSDGDDVVAGLWGNDWLRGGAGADAIIDTRGSDTIFGDGGNDVIIASGFANEAAMLSTAIDTDTGTAPDEALQSVLAAAEFDFDTDEDTRGDLVNAGNGNDMILFGLNDTVTGGGGDDMFIGGDWIDAGKEATITDFNAGADVIVYSAAAGTTPAITVDYADGATESTGDALILADGEVVMVVSGAGTNFTADLVEVITRA